MAEFRLVVPTAHFEESTRFYAGTLGFRLQRSWPDPGRGAIYIVEGDAVIELLDVADAPPVTGAFCSIQVSDARATLGRVTAAGAEPSAPLSAKPWGHLSFEVTDPNNLRIVLFEVI